MFRQLSTLSACALLLAACGGGGGGTGSSVSQPIPAPPPPEPAFALATTAPADAATSVARDTAFRASFNRPVAAASVGAGTARLIGPEGNAMPADVSVNGADISFTSPLGLPGNTTYRVELAASIADAKGATLGSAVSRTFTTAAQAWQPAAGVIGSLTYLNGGDSPIVQADRDGNVTVIWQQTSSGTGAIFAVRMDARTGTWNTPAKIVGVNAIGAIGALDMTTNSKGDVYVTFVTYQASVGTGSILRYDHASVTWSTLPALPMPVSSGRVRMVTDVTGNQTAIFQSEGVYATRFDAAAANWSTPVRIDASDQPLPYILDLTAADDGKGNLVVGWVEGTAEGRALFAARNSGSSWSTPRRLDNNLLTGMSPSFSLAVNASGSAVIGWAHNNGIAQVPTAMASMSQPGSDAWSPAVRLDAASPDLGASTPRVVLDAAGVATSIWGQYDGLFATRYNPTTGSWSAPQRVSESGDSLAAVVDAAGNVMIVRLRAQSVEAIQYLVNDAQWHQSTIGQPAADSVQMADAPAATIDAGGNVTVAWFAWTTVGGVWQYPVAVNRFK